DRPFTKAASLARVTIRLGTGYTAPSRKTLLRLSSATMPKPSSPAARRAGRIRSYQRRDPWSLHFRNRVPSLGRSIPVWLTGSGQFPHELPVVPEFGDRVADIAHCRVRGFLGKALVHVRRPTPCKFLDRRYIEIAVMEEALEARHLAMQEAAILADRISAHRRLAGRDPAQEEFHRRG